MLRLHKKIINEVIAEKRKDKNVVALLLYGSLARGTAHKDSDVDIEIVVRKGRYADTSHRRYGVKVDFETWPLKKLRRRVEKWPFLSFPYTEEKILYDPEGFAKGIQSALKRYYAKHPSCRKAWLAWRRQYLKEKKMKVQRTNNEKMLACKRFYDDLERKFSKNHKITREF